MSAVEDRLAELGLTVPEVATPVAAYVPAVRDGVVVFTSGQLPMVAGALARPARSATATASHRTTPRRSRRPARSTPSRRSSPSSATSTRSSGWSRSSASSPRAGLHRSAGRRQRRQRAAGQGVRRCRRARPQCRRGRGAAAGRAGRGRDHVRRGALTLALHDVLRGSTSSRRRSPGSTARPRTGRTACGGHRRCCCGTGPGDPACRRGVHAAPGRDAWPSRRGCTCSPAAGSIGATAMRTSRGPGRHRPSGRRS